MTFEIEAVALDQSISLSLQYTEICKLNHLSVFSSLWKKWKLLIKKGTRDIRINGRGKLGPVSKNGFWWNFRWLVKLWWWYWWLCWCCWRWCGFQALLQLLNTSIIYFHKCYQVCIPILISLCAHSLFTQSFISIHQIHFFLGWKPDTSSSQPWYIESPLFLSIRLLYCIHLCGQIGPAMIRGSGERDSELMWNMRCQYPDRKLMCRQRWPICQVQQNTSCCHSSNLQVSRGPLQLYAYFQCSVSLHWVDVTSKVPHYN